MNFKIMFLGLMFSIPFVWHAIDSKVMEMPPAGVLRGRLKGCCLDRFMEETNFVESVAGKELTSEEVADEINQAYGKFEALPWKTTGSLPDLTRVLARMAKQVIFEALLEDYPEVLKELKELKVYSPVWDS